MTSPVIHGKRVAYVSAAGVLRMRDLRTGADRGRLNLPGGAILAPPALRGDTLVAALDSANVCAVRLDSLSTLWCRKLEGDAFAGSSAPSIIGSRVYASGAVKKTAGRFGMSVGMWRRVKKLLGLVRPGDWIYDGQDVWALDLATGRVEWHSRTYASARDPGGQISGTVVARDDVGVVLLPLAGRMVGFDLRSGRELWTADVGASRGPVTIVGDRVIVARRTGELQAFSLSSGALLCSIATPLVFDQAGPARLGASLVLGSRAGVAIAVPVSALVDCSEEVVRATIR